MYQNIYKAHNFQNFSFSIKIIQQLGESFLKINLPNLKFYLPRVLGISDTSYTKCRSKK